MLVRQSNQLDISPLTLVVLVVLACYIVLRLVRRDTL
jgi:hypothetical protein